MVKKFSFTLILIIIIIVIAIASSILLKKNKKKNTGKTWKIAIAKFVDASAIEEMESGFSKQMSLLLKDNYEIKIRSAQGDIGTLNSIIDIFINEKYDVILGVTTLAVQTAIKKTKHIPIIATFIDSPELAGVDTSVKNVTGILTSAPFEEIIPILKESIPNIRKVGAVFCPSDGYSVYSKNKLTDVLAKENIELVTVPANTLQELYAGAGALCEKKIEAFCQFPDSLIASGITSIIANARKNKLPVFILASNMVEQGAVVGLGHNYNDVGSKAAELVLRIIKGENVENISFASINNQSLVVNLKAANELNFKFPESVIKKADKIIN